MTYTIHQIPLWEDNYIYVLHEKRSNKSLVVDPGSAEPVTRFLKERGLSLDFILNTHHHFDHTGGNLQLKREWQCRICGFKGDADRIPGLDTALQEGDTFCLGLMKFEVLFVPGHTRGHIAFWSREDKILFCGDTLFALGCGRLFEGTPDEMFASLGKIKKLPLDTLVYCAHEYSLKNARFAIKRDPDSKALKKRFQRIKKLRRLGRPTVPFLLKEDLLTNPFLRAKTVSEWARLRQLKDRF